MALLFMDGFDHYQTSDVMKKWDLNSSYYPVPGNLDINPTYARTPGGQGWYNSNGAWVIYKLVSTSATTFTMGCNWYYPGTTIPACSPWYVWDATASYTEQVHLGMDSTGHISVNRGATQLYLSTNTLAVQTWYHIEWKVTIHASAGVYEVRVNGSSTGWIPQQTGANTRNSSVTSIGRVSLHPYGIFDDFYFLDDQGSHANDFQGPCRIVTLRPQGAGSYAQFGSTAGSNMNAVGGEIFDGDNSFNSTTTAGNIDTFKMGGVGPNDTVKAVQHVIAARQDLGSARTIASVQRHSTTDTVGSSVTLGAGYKFVLDPKSDNPANSNAAWTPSDISGDEFGYKLVS